MVNDREDPITLVCVRSCTDPKGRYFERGQKLQVRAFAPEHEPYLNHFVELQAAPRAPVGKEKRTRKPKNPPEPGADRGAAGDAEDDAEDDFGGL